MHLLRTFEVNAVQWFSKILSVDIILSKNIFALLTTQRIIIHKMGSTIKTIVKMLRIKFREHSNQDQRP